MGPDSHFVFGTHPRHGYVAAFNSSLPAHLADWFLVREQFESVPDEPGLYRLTETERDGPRRTRQAAQDLRGHGYSVHVDADVAPTSAHAPHPNELAERRSHIAHAAASRSPQQRAAPAPSQPSARSIPLKRADASTVHTPPPRASRR
ncbi:hypothetical protein [Streptomyces sp. NPDC093589]|uniref:hypothetical protein n=1 Tax=Streptomyces sp. NPDC093589 TaxID=3366043 RepID=UPI003830CA74